MKTGMLFCVKKTTFAIFITFSQFAKPMYLNACVMIKENGKPVLSSWFHKRFIGKSSAGKVKKGRQTEYPHW